MSNIIKHYHYLLLEKKSVKHYYHLVNTADKQLDILWDTIFPEDLIFENDKYWVYRIELEVTKQEKLDPLSIDLKAHFDKYLNPAKPSIKNFANFTEYLSSLFNIPINQLNNETPPQKTDNPTGDSKDDPAQDAKS